MEQMKLGEFIAQTLTEIIDGVRQAQEYAKGKDASVNPRHVNWSDTKNAHFIASTGGPDTAPLVTAIDFDVLLTIGADEKGQVGLGVFAASLGLGVKAEAKDYSENVNRVKFQILAKMPQQH